MSQRVPFDVITTGDSKLDRIQNNVSQAIRQLQDLTSAPQTLTTNVSATLARQTTVIVTEQATKSVVISLPSPPSNQSTTIRNYSAYPVNVRTVDARTVLSDVAPGASSVVTANGIEWRNG